MSRSTATFSISLPPEMAEELERVRKSEHRTRSELVREALRKYIREAALQSVRERAAALAEEAPTSEEREALAVGYDEFRRGEYAPLHQFRHDLRRSPRKPRAKKP